MIDIIEIKFYVNLNTFERDFIRLLRIPVSFEISLLLGFI